MIAKPEKTLKNHVLMKPTRRASIKPDKHVKMQQSNDRVVEISKLRVSS